MTTLYGYENICFFPIGRGTSSWYASAAERDAELAALRRRAVDSGLAASAARAGIYPVTEQGRRLRRNFGRPGYYFSDDAAAVVVGLTRG